MNTYDINANLKEQVLAAEQAGDIEVKQRNQLYSALGRHVDKYSDEMPPEIIARYTAEKARRKTTDRQAD